VQDDLREGLERGVRTIPAFFVNDEKFEGEPTTKKLVAAIEEALVEETTTATAPKKRRA